MLGRLARLGVNFAGKTANLGASPKNKKVNGDQEGNRLDLKPSPDESR